MVRLLLRATAIGAVLLALGGTKAWAGFDEGFAAYKRGDYEPALREFRPLAKQGFAGAQFNLGLMYKNGRGVPQDYVQAVRWYRKAAEQGDAVAQSILGFMYDNGRGVPQDYIQAHKWFNLGSSRVENGERRELATKNRDIVAGRMTPAQVAEAQRLG